MEWKSWFSKRMLLALACLLAAAVSSFWLACSFKEVSPSSSFKAIKVLTNGIVTELEHQHAELTDASSPFAAKLSAWTEAQHGELLVVSADGTIMYDSSSHQADSRDGLADSSNRDTRVLSPRFKLDFALRLSQGEPATYHIAFPILDATSEAFVGYAQFALPQASVDQQQPFSSLQRAAALLVLILSFLLLVYLLLAINRYVKQQQLEPIKALKGNAEAILKGNYEQEAHWTSRNELGELYAVFDQMRVEIRSLHLSQASHSQAHKELISNLSHDLKTPLTTIKAYVEAIREGICPDLPSAMPYLDVVHANASKMSALVDDLLLHSLRDLEQIAVHPKEQYSAAVLKPMLQHIAHYIETSGVSCDAPDSYPNVLLAIDPIRIEQVIANLVANSLKHTTIGDVIALKVEENQQARALEITVADTGSGISPQDMPFIFERYYQGQAAPASSSKQLPPRHGVGLGLSICKHIVEAHGGTISFHSRSEQGTTFCIKLPLS